MSQSGGEHERTLAFAEIALGQIKALRQASTPRNYEVWYTYATGYNPSLNQTINEIQEHLAVVRTESLTDPLTGLSNRKHFDERLAQAIEEAAERSEALSLIMTDIDHFKAFNDTWGHLTGDQVLRLVAMSLKQNVKGQDTAARYGGEEFGVILPNTVLRAALALAEHLRRAVLSEDLRKRAHG